ncbi:MAG TPA: heat-inducible transcriptional repressor HrcA [Rubrobacteraceae bacterium]|jgi:heat-inducible transcriptional repressor|nr:heat-inducible transcriptional repressor HrcA [Rubrobacteraceae bacterium]
MTISVRQREILIKTLELYISTGTPVGSNALAEAVDVSSSTIRAELAALETEGLLTHPHTSAGRVPTDAGYRFYVDALIAGEEYADVSASPEEGTPFQAPEGYGNVDELLQGVSDGMSEVTRLLAVVAGPSALGDSISRVDHLPLREGAHLIVVSTQSGEATSTTITLPHVEDGELREILNSLNAFLGGRPIGTNLELATAKRFLADYNPLAVGAVLEAVEVLEQATERGLFIRGASALLARLDDLDPASLSAVVEIFERRRWLLKLVGDALVRSVSNSSGVVVSIGAESGFYNLVNTSLVAAAYKHHERPYGVVTLIGPKRMEYDAAISTVRSAAEALTLHLDSRF